MWWWDNLIEERVKQAQEDGHFDRLSNMGKPLPIDEKEGNPDEWAANHVLKEAGVLPDWLQLRKEIHAGRPEVVAALAEYEETQRRLDPSTKGTDAILARLEQIFIRKAKALNVKIDEHNIRCPSIYHEIPRFQEDTIARRRQRAQSS